MLVKQCLQMGDLLLIRYSIKRFSKLIFLQLLFINSIMNIGCINSNNSSCLQSNLIKNINNQTYKTSNAQNISWHFDKDFNSREQERVKKWLEFCLSSTNSVIGDYPFIVHFYLKKSANASEIVPWAHTIRNREQGVEFYLDLAFDDSILYSDWTAAHEISHLSLPFLGIDKSWFSEGYATFMQEQILIKMGVSSSKMVEEKYMQKFAEYLPGFNSKETMVSCCDSFVQKHNYPAMYWAGAYYFYLIDNKLKDDDLRLSEVIKIYQKNCRLKNESFQALVHSLDSISNHHYFSDYLKVFSSKPASKIVSEWRNNKL